MNLLGFDTSTDLLCAGLIIAPPGSSPIVHELCLEAGMRHAELLMDSLETLCRLGGIAQREINALVCGRGPGSFTGLRIGMAGAKGIAEALGVPLASVPALDAMAARHRHWPGLVVCLIDARKQRFYAGIYRAGIRQGAIHDIAPAALLDLLLAEPAAATPTLLTGPSADLFLERLDADAGLAEHRSRLAMALDPGWRKGWGRELLELGKQRIDGGNWDPADFGPEYVRTSDAELGIMARKAGKT